MFRYYGIPARYVEGYLITPEDIQNSPGGTIEVSQSAAHAWTEIYVDGVGFVPVETCPKFTGVMEEADYNIGISNKSVKNNFEENKEHGQAPEDTYQDVDKGIGKKASRILMIVGAIIALAILALLSILIGRMVRRKLLLQKRKKFFRNGEPKEAVRDMYRYMDEIGLAADDMTTEIGNRASYSMHQVTEHDRKIMLAVLDGAKRKFRAEKTKQKEAEKRDKYIQKFKQKSEKKADSKQSSKLVGKIGKKIGKKEKNQ
jgi:hypothetical protein